MLLRAATRRRSIVLLDFLAPSLIARVSTASYPTRKSKPASLQPDDAAAVVRKLKKQIPFIQGLKTSDTQVDTFNNTVAKLREAVTNKDTQVVISQWRHLEQNKLLHFLHPPELDSISQFLAKSFSPEQPVLDRNIVEDVALLAAAGRSTNALNAIMLAYLKREDAKAVIRLYRRFMESLGGKEGWDGNSVEQDTGNSSSTALAVDNNPKRLPHIPGRVNILLAVTAAHALQDDFTEALKACLETVIRFNDSTKKVFLKNFAHDPEFQQKVDRYVKRLDTAYMVSRPPSLSKHIMNMSGAPTSQPLEKLYQAVIDGLSGPDAYIAPDPSAVTPQRSVALTEFGWTSFLTAFLKCRRRDLASKIWTDMAQLGIKPGVAMWTALIDTYDTMRAVDDAVAGWNMMCSEGIKPDGLTYRALISTLFNGHRPDDAMKTFRTFQSKLLKNCSVPQALSVYNTVLHGLLRSDRVEEVQSLLQMMETNGPSPDIVSYNTLLAYHGRRGDFKALAGVVSQMGSRKLTGDVFTFSTLLSALLKAGREDAPDMVLSIMQKQGVQPNVATYSAIIDNQIREGTESNLRAALRMLHKMEQDPVIQPNDVTYTSILAGLYRGRWLTPEKAEEWRNDIVERMTKRGIKLNLPAYHILLKSCLEYPSPKGLENALAYYHEMVRRKMPLVHSTWFILLSGLLERDELTLAEEVIKDMFLTGAQPGGAVLELVSRIRRRLRGAQ
ncbi:hypothetical protein Hypma_015641 [Hypsizygus marmoreus]|uniref:Uncharacterized protein n=1 Tax=Hypsizygus marmoreus TaxID=39966 RepID=A0A369K3B5_HYPMA|nr:hypothetical protein Hypma_015641 [Hypsizygus marmoreus]